MKDFFDEHFAAIAGSIHGGMMAGFEPLEELDPQGRVQTKSQMIGISGTPDVKELRIQAMGHRTHPRH